METGPLEIHPTVFSGQIHQLPAQLYDLLTGDARCSRDDGLGEFLGEFLDRQHVAQTVIGLPGTGARLMLGRGMYVLAGRGAGPADKPYMRSFQPSIALRHLELDFGARLEEILVPEEIVGVYENVFFSTVGCDEPVPSNLIESHNAACSHSFHLTRIHEHHKRRVPDRRVCMTP
jgi:hypothetical protein